MRTLPWILAALFCVCVNVCAQAPAISKSATIEVSDSEGNSQTLDRWRSSYGSTSRTKAVSRELGITVRNMSGTLPAEFEVEWYFFGKPAQGSRRFIYDKGSKRLSLKPGTFDKFLVTSKELSNYRYNSAVSNRTYHSGEKAEGWIVRVKSGDEVVRVKASSPQLEQIEKNPPEFQKYVAEARK